MILLLTCAIACIVAYCSDKKVEWDPLPDNIEEPYKDVSIARAYANGAEAQQQQ